MLRISALALVVALGGAACNGESSTESEAMASEAEKSGQAPAEGAGDLVNVAADGSEYDPPVEKAQIPPDNWICDMGTVHYARPDQGDGSCGVCGMDLVRYEGDEGHGHEDEDGHAHEGEEGHSH